MKFIDVLRMCLQNLLKRIGRTFMTVSGVTIGATSVILMLSLGIGLRETFNGFMQGMGDLSTIYVYSGYEVDENGMGKEVKINQKDIAEYMSMEHVTGVKAFAQLPYGYAFVRAGDYVYQGQIYIADLSTFSQFGYKTGAGTFEGIPKNSDDLIIVGAEAVYNFYPYDDESPEGYYNEDGTMKPAPFDILAEDLEIVVIDNKASEENAGAANWTPEDFMDDPAYMESHANPVTAKAVLTKDMMDSDTIYPIFIDYSLAEKIKEAAEDAYKFEEEFDMYAYTFVEVKADAVENVVEVEDTIKATGVWTQSMESIREEFEGFAFAIQAVLGGLAGISLFVAAIGISNTMIMSITERTKEIGVMKVLGCEIGDIRKMFLLESGTIGFMGGLTGVGISYALSNVINTIAVQLAMGGDGVGGDMQMLLGSGNISIIPLWLVGFAIVFSIMIGLISGFYPANKAVKVSPLEAIRHD